MQKECNAAFCCSILAVYIGCVFYVSVESITRHSRRSAFTAWLLLRWLHMHALHEQECCLNYFSCISREGTFASVSACSSSSCAESLCLALWQAMVSFLINNRWCCESAISKPACIGRASHCMKSCESCVLSDVGAGGELKLPAPPTQPKDRLHVLKGFGRSSCSGRSRVFMSWMWVKARDFAS